MVILTVYYIDIDKNISNRKYITPYNDYIYQKPRKRPKSIALEGYYGYFEDGEISGYAGVATLSKSEPLAVIRGIGDKDYDDEGRALTLEFKDYFVVNAYVPNSGEHLVTLDKRLAWNEKFKQLLSNLDKKNMSFFAET